MKLKTCKAAAKRVTGKKSHLSRKKAYKSHLLRKKNSKRLRSLASPAKIHVSDAYTFSLMLPYH